MSVALQRVSLALFAVLALCTTSFAQNKPLVPIKFSLDWKFEGPAAGFLFAAERGYFKAEGLDVTIDTGSGSTGTVTRVASGAYDIAFADVNSMIEFNVKNPDKPLQSIFMLYDRPPFALITMKKSGIDDPKKVVGKTLGAPVFDAPRKLFPALAQALGIDNSQVKWQAMDPPLRVPMLVRGDVDGITGFDFLSLTLRELGEGSDKINVFHYYNYGIALYGNALMISEKTAKEKPNEMKGFIRAVIKGWQDAIADPQAGAALVKKYDGLVNEKVELERLNMVLNNNILTDAVKAKGVGGIDDARMSKAIDQVTLAFQLPKKVSVKETFNDEFLPPADQRKIKR
jgi:NitT/TauT family transport system substrate-binding protein